MPTASSKFANCTDVTEDSHVFSSWKSGSGAKLNEVKVAKLARPMARFRQIKPNLIASLYSQELKIINFLS